MLLTLTLVTGIAFSEEVFGKALQFNHKTVFGILSWIVFGGLLLGRPAAAAGAAAARCAGR